VTGLSARGLTVHRGSRTALEEVTFTAPRGAITAVLGGPAAGKTTLLATIAGLVQPRRGGVQMDGVALKRGVAMLPPGSFLPPGRSVRDGLRALGGRAAAGAVIEALGLETIAREKAGALTHAQGLHALAAARLVRVGEAMLVDEAGFGLEAAQLDRLVALFRAHATADRVVLVATRSAGIAMAADHVVLLAGGRVLQTGAPASVYAEPRDAASARLMGLANVLTGPVRELRPGGFVWQASGRFVQAAEADGPRVALGKDVSLCLRPERFVLLADGQRVDNELEAQVIEAKLAGGVPLLRLRSELGDLLAVLPWPWPLPGERVRLGWDAEAAWVLEGIG
jgi:ABC-2 type transport system ATP-binding protein